MTDTNVSNDTAAVSTPVAKKAGRPVSANSALTRAKTLFAELTQKGETRQNIINQFCTTFDVTHGTASVYYAKIHKAAKIAAAGGDSSGVNPASVPVASVDTASLEA